MDGGVSRLLPRQNIIYVKDKEEERYVRKNQDGWGCG